MMHLQPALLTIEYKYNGKMISLNKISAALLVNATSQNTRYCMSFFSLFEVTGNIECNDIIVGAIE